MPARLTVSTINSRISSILSKYKNNVETMRAARYDMGISEDKRRQAYKDVKEYNRYRSLLRSRSFQEISASAEVSNRSNQDGSSDSVKFDSKPSSKQGISSDETNLNNQKKSYADVLGYQLNHHVLDRESNISSNQEACADVRTNSIQAANSTIHAVCNSNNQPGSVEVANRSHPTSNETFSDVSRQVSQVCENCKRSQNDVDDLYKLDFSTISSADLQPSRNYCFLKKTYRGTRPKPYNVCYQCKEHLTNRNIDIAHDSKHSFAAFVWSILSNASAQEFYGSDFLWSIIPSSWRHWWIDSLLRLYPNVYLHISLVHPIPIIVDRTKDLKEWKENISTYKLSNLRDCCNKFLLPTVLCPMGCSEFLHRTGSICFLAVMQRYLQVADLKLRSHEDYHKCISFREDFFRSSIMEFDPLLMNPNWHVLPSIVFIHGQPMFMTCRHHDGGTLLSMVHVCRWKHNLPSALSDQHAQAVVQPNCIRPMRTAAFSHRYQMYEQRFSMKGVESINVSSAATFSHDSLLLWESEARALGNRSDMAPHLNNLISDGKLSRTQAASMSEYSLKYCANVSFEKLCFGGTVVPLEISMLMQKEAKNRQIVVVNENGEEAHRFSRIWFSYLYPCQRMTSYGTPFISPPIFARTKNNAAYIWQLSAMLLCIEPLWTLLATKDFYKIDSWYCYLMVYLSKMCINMNNRKQRKNDCFKLPGASEMTFANINNKIPRLSFQHLFSEFNNIQCFSLSTQTNKEAIFDIFDNYVEVNFVDFIIFSDIRGTQDLPFNLISVSEEKFELVFISSLRSNDNERWDSVVYCRHGGDYCSWWSKFRDDQIYIQIQQPPRYSESKYVGVYVKVTSPDFEKHKNEMLLLLGGQGHIRCQEHRTPLIVSNKNWNCSCNIGFKREYLRCSATDCCVGICKRCSKNFNPDEVSYIQCKIIDPNNDESDSSSSSESSDNNDDDSDSTYSGPPSLKSRSGSSDTSSSCSDDDMDDDSINDGRDSYSHNLPLVDRLPSDYGNTDSVDSDEPPGLIHSRYGPFRSWYSSDTSRTVGSTQYESSKSRSTSNNGSSNSSSSNSSSSSKYDYDLYKKKKDDDESVGNFSVQEYDPFGSNFMGFFGDGANNMNNEAREHGVFFSDPPAIAFGEIPDSFENTFEFPMDTDADGTEIPTTNAGNERLEIAVETAYGGVNNEYRIGGSGLLIEATPLLTRKLWDVSGSRYDKHFVQRFCATTRNTSVPLLWPEATMFPSIFYSNALDKYSMCGAIPAPLMNVNCTQEGFCSIPDHIRTRLTFPGSSTSTDHRYISYCYDVMSNLAANFNDTRMFSRHGLTSADDDVGGLKQRGEGDSSLNNAVDSHNGAWKDYYPNFYVLAPHHQKEIERAIIQSAQGLLLRVWEEVSALFIDLLKKSSKSPFFKTFALFARKEYQSEVGNLSHIHALLKICWRLLTGEEREFIKLLIRASVCDIVRSDEVEYYIREGIIESYEDVPKLEEEAYRFLSHKCDSRCLVPTPDGGMRCRKLPNYCPNVDNTKDSFIDLPRNFSITCIKRLMKCGLATPIKDESGQIVDFGSPVKYFHPKRHIPRSSGDVVDSKISPLETSTFGVCRSMQNIQRLYGCGECCKYCCKYIGKIDDQNYMHVAVGEHGELIRKAYFLHNTKITSSKMAQDEQREKSEMKKNKKEVHGRCVSVNEMLHQMLKYPDVYSDLVFKKIPTTSLEFRVGTKLMLERTRKKKARAGGNNSNNNNNDAPNSAENTETDENEVPYIVSVREELLSDEVWRHPTEYQRIMLTDIKLRNGTKVDSVTQFSLRPPELCSICDKLGSYYRWFSIGETCMKKDEATKLLEVDLWRCGWVDLLQCQVKLRKKAIPEICQWLDLVENEDGVSDAMVAIIRKISYVYSVPDISDLIEDDKLFFEFASENLVHDDKHMHLPIPVFDYIKPTMGPQFLHHLLLSLGRFTTELDLVFHPNIRTCFKAAKLIGDGDDPASLEVYSGRLLNLFIRKQLIYFPNGQGTIDSWIIHSGELFDSVIIRDEVAISEMPSVLVSALFQEHSDEIDRYVRKTREDIVDAALREMGDKTELFNLPSCEELLSATIDSPANWDPVESFIQGEHQSDESFNEQKKAIILCVNQINSYCDLLRSGTYTKNVILSGFPGAGKTFILMYAGIYCISKGLFTVSTAMLAHRAVQLGGIHWHKLLCIPTDDKISITRRAEVAIHKLSRKPKKLEMLRRINVLLSDEKSQHSSEITQCIDIICRRLRCVNLFFGGMLEIGTMDHSQLQPINGRPFLSNANVIPCYKLVSLKKSVRAANDERFYRLQQLTRLDHDEFERNPELINEFKELARGFTFVDDWNDQRITPTTFRVYAKQVPAKEASKNFLDTVRALIPSHERRHRKSLDFEKRRQSRQDWVMASESTSTMLESKLKEPRDLLFFRGAIYQCTYNQDEKFNQSQLAFCFELPNQDDLEYFRPVKILLFPTTLKFEDFSFDPNASKEHYINQGFVEISMGVSPERVKYLNNDVQGFRKQYGLRHYVSGTIHSTMGDTYHLMAICISSHKMWEKGQLVVICSRTRRMKDTIFVGNEEEVINSLAELLTKRTMWSDYMNRVLKVISIDTADVSLEERALDQSSYPYRVSDISLPEAQTGYVFFMKSIKDDSCVYIDSTNCLRTRLWRHNSGYDSSLYPPAEKRPFTLLAYICGFDRKPELMSHVKTEWEHQYDGDPFLWARNGQNVIDSLGNNNFHNIESTKLTLVCLFRFS